MKNNKRNPLVTKFEHAVWRPMMLNQLYDRLDLVLLAEFPKSGGTWASQMISDYLGIPYPRNQLPKLEKCLMHGHYLYNERLKSRSFVVCRDGRDVMVSWYHHCLFDHGFNHYMVERVKKDLNIENVEDVRGNLSRFIEYSFETKRPIGLTWVDFMESWLPHTNYIIRYENLLNDAPKELRNAMLQVLGIESVDMEKLSMIVGKYAFSRQAGRKEGQEKKSSFLRKGIAGDWMNHFDEEAKTTFSYYAGDMLTRLGYEERNIEG